MKVIITQLRWVWLPVLLLWNAGLIAPLLSYGQTATVKSGGATRSNTGSKATPKEFLASGNTFTLNLDRQGTSLSITFPYEHPTPEGTIYPEQIWIPAAFGVKDGCNGWFAKEAIFILDQSWTIKVPWAADCPLPPKAKFLPVWMLESIASATSVSIKLDGMAINLSVRQVAALKSFVESRCLPSESWRTIHEPYALPTPGQPPVLGARFFASDLLHKIPADTWDVRKRVYLNQSIVFESDEHGLTINRWGSPDPEKEDGVSWIHKSWSLSWADVVLNGDFLVCDRGIRCVSILSERVFNVPGTKPWRTKDNDTRDTLYEVPGSAAYSDFNRVTAYLWYQNTFVNQAR